MLAGVNGAGKTSVAGAALRQKGGEYLNPDEATRRIFEDNPGLSLEQANSVAWQLSRDRLVEAIRLGRAHAFETTLGGRTITGLLLEAARAGAVIRVFYMGLASVEQHIARVQARVRRGGHHIPEDRIRARYRTSRQNLIRLLPHLEELVVWDNSAEADPAASRRPEPFLVLHLRSGEIVRSCPASRVPHWAKPIVRATSEMLATRDPDSTGG